MDLKLKMTSPSTTREKLTNTVLKDLRAEIRRVNDTEISGFHLLQSAKGKITYYLFYRINGKQVNYKLGSHPDITPAQARDLAKKRAGEVANGVDVQAEKKQAKLKTERERLTKLSVFLDQKYLPYQTTRNAKTAEKIINTIKTGFPEFLNKQLSDITAYSIEKWRNQKKKAGLADSTINGYVASLKAALSRAVDWDLLDGHDLQKVKALKSDNTVVRFLSGDELERLTSTMRERDKRIKDERDNANKFRQQRGYELFPELREQRFADHIEPIVLLTMHTGLRKSEVLGLRWDHVDLERKFITIEAGNAKSGKIRHISLNPTALNVLKDWHEFHVDTVHVFEGEEGKALTDIKKGWTKLLKEAEIENFRFHDLRHHFASMLAMAGADMNSIRELLGHSSMEMTLRYAHLAPEHKAAVVNLIG